MKKIMPTIEELQQLEKAKSTLKEILKDKKDIEKEKYKPFNFTYGRILWILNLKEDW